MTDDLCNGIVDSELTKEQGINSMPLMRHWPAPSTPRNLALVSTSPPKSLPLPSSGKGSTTPASTPFGSRITGQLPLPLLPLINSSPVTGSAKRHSVYIDVWL